MPTKGSHTRPMKPSRSLLPEWFRRAAVPLARLVVGIAAITAVVVALFTWIATDGFSGNVVILIPSVFLALGLSVWIMAVAFRSTKN